MKAKAHIARSGFETCSKTFDQVAMLQIDLAKASDRVRHDVLFNVLSHANVGCIIEECLKIAYRKCSIY